MATIARAGLRAPAKPLPFLDRIQRAFGAEHDFSQVRAHVGGAAAEAASALSASAYTYGDDIVFARTPTLAQVAHEAAHIVQQRRGEVGSLGDLAASGPAHERAAEETSRRLSAGNSAPEGLRGGSRAGSPQPAVQRSLLVSESTRGAVNRFRALMEPATGLMLAWNATTRIMEAVGSRATPATSPTLAFNLETVMDDQVFDAEINLGDNQPNVEIGLFPTPDDLSGSRVQNIDMDDVEAVEAGAPGHGVAFLAHEIWENYQAHHFAIQFGGSAFDTSHEDALVVEGQIVTDLVGPGERVAEVEVPTATGQLHIDDYGNHYLAYDRSRVGDDVRVRNARVLPKRDLGTWTIDHFDFDSSDLPTRSEANAAVAVVRALLRANPLATLRIDGFTDSVGTEWHNVGLATRRIRTVRQALGIDADRVHAVAHGEADPVAPNNTAANRARNRRVVVRVGVPVL